MQDPCEQWVKRNKEKAALFAQHLNQVFKPNPGTSNSENNMIQMVHMIM